MFIYVLYIEYIDLHRAKPKQILFKYISNNHLTCNYVNKIMILNGMKCFFL